MKLKVKSITKFYFTKDGKVKIEHYYPHRKNTVYSIINER